MRLYYRTLMYATKAFPKPRKRTRPPTDQVTTVNCPCACYEGIRESGGKVPLNLITRSVYKMSGSASRPENLIPCTNWKGYRVGLDAFQKTNFLSPPEIKPWFVGCPARCPLTEWGTTGTRLRRRSKLVKWPSNMHAPSSVFYAFYWRPKVTKAINVLQSTRFWKRCANWLSNQAICTHHQASSMRFIDVQRWRKQWMFSKVLVFERGVQAG